MASNESTHTRIVSTQVTQGESPPTQDILLNEAKFDEAKKFCRNEKREKLDKTITGIGKSLQSGNGLKKFLPDTITLNDWCNTMLEDKNIQHAITGSPDTSVNKEEFNKACEKIAGNIFKNLGYMAKRSLTLADLTNVLRTLVVHDAIQKLREDNPEQIPAPTKQQIEEARDADVRLQKAWYAFNNVLNPIVFRRYRMNAEANLKNLDGLKFPKTLSSESKLVQTLLMKLQSPGIVENFFNEEKAFLQCSINNEFISKPLAESTEEVLDASEDPSGEKSISQSSVEETEKQLDQNHNVSNGVIPTYYTSELDSSDKQTVLDQLNEASVIALLNTAIEVKLSAKDEKEQNTSNPTEQDTQQKKQPRENGITTRVYKMLKKLQCFSKKGATDTQHNNERRQMLSEQLQEDNSEELKKELIQKVEANTSLSEPEKEAQKNALTRIMGRAKNACRIKNSEFFTGEQVTEMQQQALKNAQTYLEQRLYALNGELSKKNNTACASIIDSMVSVAEKIDQTTKTIGKEMHQNVSTWQKTLFPKDSSSTEANGMNNEINNEINKLLIDIESIASQRTYNSCLETLKTLKSTIAPDPTHKQAVQAQILAMALSEQIKQAEKKGPFRQFLDYLKKLIKLTQNLTAETLLTAKPRSRMSREGEHKESEIVKGLEDITSKLIDTQHLTNNLSSSLPNEEQTEPNSSSETRVRKSS